MTEPELTDVLVALADVTQTLGAMPQVIIKIWPDLPCALHRIMLDQGLCLVRLKQLSPQRRDDG